MNFSKTESTLITVLHVITCSLYMHISFLLYKWIRLQITHFVGNCTSYSIQIQDFCVLILQHYFQT